MAFDGITLNSVIKELNSIVGARINSVFEPTPHEIIISVYNGSNLALDIDVSASNYRMNLTTHQKKNPQVAPQFCMLLRKYLIGGRIKRIYNKGLERIAYIECECINEMNDRVNRTLIIELMGKYSNIVLVNESFTIIDALKKFDSEGESRSIMPARPYVEPSENKSDFTQTSEKDFVSTILNDENKTLETAIPNNYTGISKMFIQSTINELNFSNTIGEKTVKAIYNYISDILNSDNFSCVSFKNNYSIVSNKEEKEVYQTNFFLDDFYFKKDADEYFINYRNTLLKILNGTLDKVTKKMDNIDGKIESCRDMDKYKEYGELILSNIYKFEDEKYNNFIEVENFYNNNELIKIKIDSNISASQNAEKYFKKYNKMKNTLKITKIQKEETERELDYLGSLIEELDRCQNVQDIDDVYNEINENILFTDIKLKGKNKKQAQKDKSTLDNYLRTTVDEYDCFIGKNNRQNDNLTLKVARDNDIWLHTKDIHGSHVILRTNGEMPKISTIEKAAKLAAYHSKAKYSSHVPVDYCFVKFVKKPKGSVPGYVIYSNNKTIYVDP